MKLIQIGWFILGIFQWFAIIAGIKLWFGISTFFAFIISLIITCIPLLGTIVGFKGAVDAWEWSFFEASALFFGPFVFLIFFSLLNSRSY
tara:strand:+ start:539 stop:808 length:270 start_codon:yes stop_codon:yes gene_type:complete